MLHIAVLHIAGTSGKIVEERKAESNEIVERRHTETEERGKDEKIENECYRLIRMG